MRGNVPVNLVFNVYWSTDVIVSDKWSYINAVYELIVIDEIDVQLSASSTKVDLE